MPAVYIAGPMRGLPKHNFPAFDEAAVRLSAAGYTVFNPADYDREIGLTEETKDEDVTDDILRKCLRSDVAAITVATHIALLPGWEGSKGARPEIILAFTLGLTFIDAVTLEEIIPSAAVVVVGSRLIGAVYQDYRNSVETDLTRIN